MGMGWLDQRHAEYRALLARYRSHGVGLIGGSEPASATIWEQLVTPVARMFLYESWGLVYCGMGSGLAGAIAREVAEGGGSVKGVLVAGAEPPDVPADVERIVVKDFHQRRRRLFNVPKAFLVLPGGMGTIAELTDLVAWTAAGLLDKEVVLLDPTNWFSPLVKMYGAASKHGVSKARLQDTIRRVKSVEAAEKALDRALERPRPRRTRADVAVG